MSISTSQAYKDKFDALVKSWTLKLFIKDDNGKYVDFSDRTDTNGKNLLKTVGSIGFVQEKIDGTGLSRSQGMNVRLDNSSGFFSKPFSSMTTESGAVAIFADSENAKQSILYNRDAQVRIEVVFHDGRTEEGIVGTYRTGRMSRSKIRPDVSLQLRDKSLALRTQNSAERVKDGLSYYANRNIPFLLREILKVSYAQSDGTLPSSFIIPDTILIESAKSIRGDSGDQRVVSHFGRPPEQDSTGAFLKKGLVCRALVFGPNAAGLPVDGTLNTLYFGLDNELWSLDPITERSISLGSLASISGRTVHIRRIWYSSDLNKIVIFGYNDSGNFGRIANARLATWDGTTIATIGSSFSVFLSDFCFRDGDSGTVGETRGENIPAVYSQYATAIQQKAVVRHPTIDDTSLTNFFGRTKILIEPGSYYSFSGGVIDPATVRFSFGQKGFFVFNIQSPTDAYFWFATMDEVTEEIDIERISLTTGAAQVIVANLNTGTVSKRLDPLCGCPDTSTDDVYLGGIFWDDGAGTPISQAQIKKISSSGTVLQLYAASSQGAAGEKSFTPIDMVHDETKLLNELVISMFARDRLGKFNSWIVATHADAAVGDINNKLERQFPMIGLTKGVDSDSGTIYMSEQGTGRILKYDISANTLIAADDSFPPVENEYNLSTFEFAVDPETRSGTLSNIIYGVSSPVGLQTEAYESIPIGKFYLFKLDKFYSSRIDLFKTVDLSSWQAIERLSQMTNHATGFDRSGDFFFVSKTPASSSDYELRADDTNKRIIDIVVEDGTDEIFNIVRVSPYTVFLEPPRWELRLVVRETLSDKSSKNILQKKPFDSDIFIQQKDDRRKTYRLECASGGLVSVGKVKLRWRSIDERFETRLTAAVSVSATTCKIASGIDSVRAGDSVRFEGAEDVKETKTVANDPTNAEKETGTITFTTAFTNAFVVKGTLIEITNNLSQWSDRRGNFITDSFFQNWTSSELDDWTEDTVGGTIDAEEDSTSENYLFGESAAELTMTVGTDTHIFQDILASKFEPSTKYTVLVYAKCGIGDASDNRADSMQVKVTGGAAIDATVSAETTSENFDAVQVTFTTNSSPSGNVRIELHVKGTSTCKGWVDGCFLMKGETAFPDYLLIRNSSWIPIADSNVEFKFEPQTSETEMLAGDQLIIECPGLDNVREESSIITATSINSRNEFGDIEYPAIDNPFLSRGFARDVGERIRDEFAFPKYQIKIVTPILPYINFVTNSIVTSVSIVDEEFFKKSPQWTERGRLRGISDNLKSGISTFILRSLTKI